MNIAVINTPIGFLEISEENDAVKSIKFIDEPIELKEDKSYYLTKIISQLTEFFAGKRKNFDLKLVPEGTDFQKDVWKELLKIPFGDKKSYQEIAVAIGDPGASRAVGNANNKNPIPILIPCHRVVGAHGKLTGYAGGLYRKDWLLNHELNFSDAEMQLDLF